MPVHYENYPATPCGIPMCRAGIVTKDPSHVTCESCLLSRDCTSDPIFNVRLEKAKRVWQAKLKHLVEGSRSSEQQDRRIN